jgi:hypothetical protein
MGDPVKPSFPFRFSLIGSCVVLATCLVAAVINAVNRQWLATVLLVLLGSAVMLMHRRTVLAYRCGWWDSQVGQMITGRREEPPI